MFILMVLLSMFTAWAMLFLTFKFAFTGIDERKEADIFYDAWSEKIINIILPKQNEMNLIKVKIIKCTDGDKYTGYVDQHGLVYDHGNYYRIPHVDIRVKKEDCEPCNELGRNF